MINRGSGCSRGSSDDRYWTAEKSLFVLEVGMHSMEGVGTHNCQKGPNIFKRRYMGESRVVHNGNGNLPETPNSQFTVIELESIAVEI